MHLEGWRNIYTLFRKGTGSPSYFLCKRKLIPSVDLCQYLISPLQWVCQKQIPPNNRKLKGWKLGLENRFEAPDRFKKKTAFYTKIHFGLGSNFHNISTDFFLDKINWKKPCVYNCRFSAKSLSKFKILQSVSFSKCCQPKARFRNRSWWDAVTSNHTEV
jgi:hypothetical protein